MKILILNGPNLNLLGTREPGIYGSNSFDSYLPQLQQRYPDVQLDYYQSNIEGELINKMQEVASPTTASCSTPVPTRTPASPCKTASVP